MKKLLIALIHIYRYTISPLLMPSCRYNPSCSIYMIQAIEMHGIKKGIILGFKRLMKCRPSKNNNLYQGHYDPIPTKSNLNKTENNNEYP